MSVGKYVGSRYIPKAADPILHDSSKAYEHLMMVQDAQGGCWMSTKPVPPGIQLQQGEYWMFISDWDAQVAEYHAEVQRYDTRIANLESNVEQVESSIEQVESSIEQADQSIATETQARTDADAEIRGELAAETQARENAIETIDADNWVTTNRINDNAITYDKLSVELQNRNSAIDMLIDINTYIDGVNGDDETAEIGNREKPFKTLDAAFKAADERGNDFRFYFLVGGVYTWTMRVMVGSVVHFFTADASSAVTVNIDNQSPEGGVFFYDTHLGVYGTEAAPITIVAPQYIEIEGGTLWTSGRVKMDMKYLYLIDGSAQLAHLEMTRGYITGKFGNIIFDDVVINNREEHAAFDWSCGVLRCQGSSMKIGRNPNGTDQIAILLRSCTSNFNSSTGQTVANTDYNEYMHCYSGIAFISDALLQTFNDYGRDNSVVGGIRIRGDVAVG